MPALVIKDLPLELHRRPKDEAARQHREDMTRQPTKAWIAAGAMTFWSALTPGAEEFPKPYSPPCIERENVFEFTEKPAVKKVGEDKYEIAFAVKGFCDATVGLIDPDGKVVRHLGAGVLGSNAPLPFVKNSLRQTLFWNGKDDLNQYVKEPEKLRAQVRLGLKPVFDKRLGGTDGRNIPGRIWGMTADANGVYLASVNSRSRVYLRQFDFDGNYAKTVFPPPAGMPEAKLHGMGYVEYEPGKRALQCSNGYETTAYHGLWLPCVPWGPFAPRESGQSSWCQPVVVKGRIYYLNTGRERRNATYLGDPESALHYVYTDGSTDIPGTAGRRFFTDWPVARHINRWLAASPDGQWIYMTGLLNAAFSACVVLRCSVDGTDNAALFAGKFKEPGSDNAHLNDPRGLACDAQGRVYVCDKLNNRLQVFSPQGEYLKTMPVDAPVVVQVHGKTGAIYVLHSGKKEGRSTTRVTKFAGFDNPLASAYADVSDLLKVSADCMALDSWSAKPRIWLGANARAEETVMLWKDDKDWLYPYVTIWEEDGASFKKILDFHAEARREAGESWGGKWSGDIGQRVVCDPTRETAWFGGGSKRIVFDMRSGKCLGQVSSWPIDDVAFCKRGYMHCHFHPDFFMPGVGRVDPERCLNNQSISERWEVPYDYGVEKSHRPQDAPWRGVLPVRDQGGSKGFQDGIGVNMCGDVAVHSTIIYTPRMGDAIQESIMTGAAANAEGRAANDGPRIAYERFHRFVADLEKKGEEVASVPRRPGIPNYATIWTFNRNGELRAKYAVIMGNHINGVQMDEDGALYFTSSSRKMINGEPFLKGKGGIFGVPDLKLPPSLCAELAYSSVKGGSVRDPKTGSFFKTGGKAANTLLKNPLCCSSQVAIPMDPWPSRPQDILGGWLEGDFEWAYAGASPMVQQQCSCPTFRAHTDWYKRSFVQEEYRHSFAALDTNGNLILHFGQYGNFDSGNGANGKVPLGGDNVSLCFVKFLSGTDNYLCYEDWGERLVVVKLNYHAEEIAPVEAK